MRDERYLSEMFKSAPVADRRRMSVGRERVEDEARVVERT